MMRMDGVVAGWRWTTGATAVGTVVPAGHDRAAHVDVPDDA
jgi:hypothetical protein